jgi:hypothetical protein
MSKHTPGPWVARHDGNGGNFWLKAPNGKYIISGCGCCDSPYLPSDNPDADARLIAAAPELLEALEKMRSVFLDMDGTHGWAEQAATEAADAAIRKAKGE